MLVDVLRRHARRVRLISIRGGFRAFLIVLLLATPALADNPPRYHKGGATVARFHASNPKPVKQPKPSKPSTDHIRYIIRHYHVK